MLPRFDRDREKYRYPVVIGLLGLVVLGLGVGLFSGLLSDKTPAMELADGGTVEVDIASIKKDLAYFQRMDPTSDEKSHLYRQLVEKLDFLENE